MTRKQIERAGRKAIRMLRENNLSNGIPFMINCKELPPYQCYYEYPDGSMKLMTLSDSRMDIVLIRELGRKEVETLRRKYKLLQYSKTAELQVPQSRGEKINRTYCDLK